jgi:two-component system, sensor histidine kinase and response regulator
MTSRTKNRIADSLADGADQYLRLFESLPHATLVYDLETLRFLTANNAAQRLYGYSRDEFLELTFKDLSSVDPSPSAEVGTPTDYRTSICRHRTKRAELIIVEITSRPIVFGGLPASLLSVSDVTGIIRLQERVKESDERYRNIIDSMEEGCWEVDLKGRFTFFNEATLKLHGRSSQEMMGLGYTDFVDEETAKRVFHLFGTVSRTGESAGGVAYEIIRADGTRRAIETRISLIKDSGSRPVGFRGVFWDITERKRSEEVLKQSEERYRTIIEDLTDAYWEADISGNFTFFNSQVPILQGRSKTELMGLSNREYMDEETTKRAAEVFKEVYRTGSPVTGFEYEMTRGDGTKWCAETNVSLIKDSEGNPVGFRGISRDATARKRAEEALRQSEERYRAIIDNMEDGYWETDIAGRFTFFNKQVVLSHRRTREQLTGLSNKEFMDEETLKRVAEVFKRVYQTGEPVTAFTVEQTRGDGTKWFAETNVALIRDSEGKPAGFRGVSRDVTARTEADEALRRSEERYRTIIDAIEDGYWEASLSGRFTFLNNAMLKLHGSTRGEMIGLSYKQYMTSEMAAMVRERFGEVYKTGVPARGLSSEIIRADGTRRTTEVTVSLIRDPAGKAVGFRGVTRDVTERMRAEESLRQSEERYRTIIDQMTDSYWETDIDGNFTFFNNQVAVEQRRTREELMGLNNRQFMDDESVEYCRKRFGKVFVTGEPMRGLTYELLRGDGVKYTVESNISLIKNAAGEPVGFRGVSRDITERKLAENEVKRARDAAEAASRAKSEFLANMSHEIRTPMNGIIGMTELTLDTDLTSEQREYLGMVKVSANSLLGIISEILDFSKIEAGKLELDSVPFSLRDNLDDPLKALAVRAHQKELELVYSVQPGVPDALIGDPGRLRQIIVNLIGNAIKFTNLGEILLRVELDSLSNEGVFLHFSVTDSGIGIPKETQPLIFEAFSQADGSTTRKYGGTGLGLTISSRLVEMMNGRIWIDSVVGQGSAFHFTARFAEQPKSTPRTASISTACLKDLPILVVEDNAVNSRVLEEMLTVWQMAPTMVGTGQLALESLDEALNSDQPFPLVLLDAHMPGIAGFELAHRIKQRSNSACAIIMMLRSTDLRGDAARCREMGLSSYLIKPVKESRLLDVMMMGLGESTSEPIEPVKVRRSLVGTQPGLNILLAEDNLVNQRLTIRLLEKQGHRVVLANNGREAVEAVTQQRFDLILMDVQMPEMNGFEATAAIRQTETAGPRLPIIAMTAHAMKGDRERCLASGMDGYVSKPVSKGELESAIRELVHTRIEVEV